jgi:hypothetical protein
MTARFVMGCSAQSALARCIAGSPSRRPGNFLLRGQKKVTKEEALNRTPELLAQAGPRDSQWAAAHTRTAALSLLSLSPAPRIAPAARLTRGCTPCSRENQTQRRSGDAIRATPFVGWGERSEPQRHGTAGVGVRCAHPNPRRPSDVAFAFADEPGVQPALTGVKAQCVVLVIGTAARAQRFASARKSKGCFRAPLLAAPRWFAVQGLFFGDFLLAPQKKVTRPPGRTPGNAAMSSTPRQSIPTPAPKP